MMRTQHKIEIIVWCVVFENLFRATKCTIARARQPPAQAFRYIFIRIKNVLKLMAMVG